MNYIPHQPVMPGRRPVPVTTAVALMVGMTVIFVLIAGILVYALLSMPASSNSDDYALQVTGIITGFVFFAVGLSVMGLALGVLRGHNGARITTLVLYGFFLLFGVCVGGLWLLSMTRVDDASSQMAGIFLIGLTLLEIVILAITMGLLMGRQSRDWFATHKRARAAGLL